jgi:hypothetical protein
MTSPQTPVKLATPVWNAFCRHAHDLLRIGYQEALSRIRTESEEEQDITGYICASLKKWLRANPGEYDCFDVHEEPPVELSGKAGKHRPRADIIITYTAKNRPEFCFEAKRLHRKKATAARYTGTDGMGCFISERYAGCYAEGAMIGYVQTDTIERWLNELQKRVRKEEVALHLERVETSVNFASAFPLEWASLHHRKTHGSIRLFHIMLDCQRKHEDAPRPPILHISRQT